MPDTPRFFRYAVLAAMFPVAVLGLVATPNEYRAIGMKAVDCDGPIRSDCRRAGACGLCNYRLDVSLRSQTPSVADFSLFLWTCVPGARLEYRHGASGAATKRG
ncbi:hypothetical protein [Agrobacterium tumefaciens]|uniref:hypothetical protein n=1 Tax=Agrobacterium tumefaciens TaxID=358 RepID=UPI002789443D|nr:hypothetical protein [Agrobacterium tumefaciens]MDP9872920.1 hypothetical protein [Agrobacterium tumefaciens]MDP9978464.1 hypothetical protein [Agrobacterium tumefaciens]